jgi:hypothetical protein
VLLERTTNIALDPERAPRWVRSLMVRRREQLPIRLVAGSCERIELYRMIRVLTID